MARWWEDQATLRRLEQIARRKAQQPGNADWRLNLEALRGAPEPETVAPVVATPSGEPTRWAMTYRKQPQESRQKATWLDVGVQLPGRRRSVEPRWTPGGRLPVIHDLRRRLREAWAGVGAPREELSLGQAAQEAARQAMASSVSGWEGIVGPSAAPGGGGPVGAMMPLVGAGVGLLGAAWHDWKQMPVVGSGARVAEAAAKTGLELLNVPAAAVEQALGARSLERMVREQEAVESGQASEAELAARRHDVGRTYRNLIRSGYAPEEAQAALREATRIAYSRPETVERAARRILAGEDPRTVFEGREVDTQAAKPEDREAVEAYLRGVYERARAAGATEGRAQAMVDAARRKVLASGRIPAEGDVLRELGGQVLLDPLNVADVAVGVTRGARAVRRAEEALGAAPEAARAAGAAQDVVSATQDVARAAEAAPEATRAAAQGVARAAETAPDLARAAEQSEVTRRGARAVLTAVVPEKWRSWAGRMWKRVNPFELTEASRARQAVDDAGVVVGTLLADTQNADEAVDVLRRFAEEPESLRGLVGDLPEWTRAQEARGLLRKVADRLDEMPSVKAARSGGPWNPAEFVLDLDNAVLEALSTAERAEDGGQALLDYKRFADNYRGLMSEFYLRTPGYAVRNAAGDLMTMATDGVLDLNGWETVARDLKRIGPTTRRVTEALAGGVGAAQRAEIGSGSRLGKLVGSILGEGAGKLVGGLSEGMGRFVSTGRVAGRRTLLGEETRYAKAFHAGLMRALGETWRPRVPQELAQALGPQRTRALERMLRQSLNQDEMLRAVKRVTRGTDAAGLFDYGAYLGDEADELSLELVRRLDEALREATTPEEVQAVFDTLDEALDGELGRALAADPLPPVRRMNMQAARLQDAAEDAASVEQMGRAAGLQADEAAQAAQAHAAAMAEEAAATAAQEETLLAQAGQAMETADDPRAVAQMVRQVRVETHQLQMDTRRTVDELRRQTYQRLQALNKTEMDDATRGAQRRAIWQQYYDDVSRIRQDEQATVRQMLQGAQERLARGDLGAVEDDAVQRAVARYRSQLESLVQRRERLGRLGMGKVANLAEDEADFAQRLEEMRLAVDEAQHEAWRVAVMNPSADALDIVTEAERDLQNIGAGAAARHEAIYQQWQASWRTKKPWTKEEFRARVDAVWRKAFQEQANRMDMARRELFSLPIGPRARATMLQELGWPPEAIEGLSDELAHLILRERVAWDPAAGGPVIPLAQLEEWTLETVAKRLGLDVSDPRMISASDWQKIAERAERDARLYRALSSEATAYFEGAIRAEEEPRAAALAWWRAQRWAAANDPAFPERMRQGADRLEEIAAMARARATLGTRQLGVGIGTLPEGAQYVERARLGDLYEVRVMREGEVAARAVFDNPADALREAKRLHRAIRRGEAVPREWVPLSLEDAAARFGVEAGDPDEWGRLADEATSRATELLERVERRSDARRRALFEAAVEDARRLRGYNPEDEAKYAAGMLPRGFGLGGETRWDARNARGADEMTDVWYQVISPKAEDEGALGELADLYQRRVLGLAGMSDVEIERLKPQQRRRLLEELARGEMLRTQADTVAQIDGITPERRARLLKDAPQEIQALAQGALADPGRALAYQWLSIAEAAEARSETARLLSAGLIQPDEVEALVADAGARRALLEAMEAMGLSPASDSVATALGEVDDEVEEAVRRLVAGGMDVDEAAAMGRKAMGDQAAREALLERAGLDGGMLLDEALEVSQRAGTTAEPPTLGEMADVIAQQQKRLLRQIREGMLGSWPDLAAARESRVPPWVEARLRKWINGELGREWARARTVAVEAARQMADFALLDYGKRRRVDTWLNMVVPYSYWTTRSARNWALRLAQRPALLAHYLRYRRAMQEINERRGYRSRFEGAVAIPAKGLPEWMGGELLVKPETLFFPFASLAPNEWEDASQARNGVDWLYRTLQRYGFRPYGFIEAGLTAAGVIGESGLPGEQSGWRALVDVPQVRMVRGALALARKPGQGPVAPTLGEWDSYRIARMLGNMAAERPMATPAMLLAHALLQRVAYGELDPREVLDGSPNLERLAELEGWSADDLAGAQSLLREAWLRTQQEAAIPALTSGLLGTAARIYPAGERRQVALQGELKASAYSALTGTGSRAEYEALRAQHPETYARTMAYQFVPGEQQPEGGAWSPETARGTLLYREEKAQAEQELEEAQLAALRERGLWDSQALREARDAYSERTAEARARLGLGEYQAGETWAPRYGSTPQEAQKQAQETLLGAVSSVMPRRGDYEDERAYQAAKTAFWRAIRSGDLEGAGVTLPDGLPEDVVASAQALTPEDLEAYWRENDTLAEALANAFGEWYGAQWESYRKAAGPAVTPGLPKTDAERRRVRREAAWQRFVERGRSISQAELVARVKALYGDRWTEKEIRAALAGVKRPTLREAWLGRMSPEERAQYEEDQALAEAREAFWDAYWSLPEDADWRSTKGQPLVALILDRGTRGMATREQYEAAAAVLRRYLAEHPAGADEGTGKRGQGERAVTRVTTGGGGRRQGEGGIRRQGGGGTGRREALVGDWRQLRRMMSGALSRQLADYFLRGRALGPGARRELEALAKRLGWSGDLESLLEALRTAFKARAVPTGAPG